MQMLRLPLSLLLVAEMETVASAVEARTFPRRSTGPHTWATALSPGQFTKEDRFWQVTHSRHQHVLSTTLRRTHLGALSETTVTSNKRPISRLTAHQHPFVRHTFDFGTG